MLPPSREKRGEALFIWDFVADTVLNEILDWLYSQLLGFLGNFFAEMGNMGAEVFEMAWVQGIVQFFSYLAWTLYATGLVVSCFEVGIGYVNGHGDIRSAALNAIKGFFAVSLFTVVPIRLYIFSVSLQAHFTAGLTGYGSGSLREAAVEAIAGFDMIESLTEGVSGASVSGLGALSSPVMVLFCIGLMAYAVISVFFANLKRGGILLIQIAVGSLYMFSVPRGYVDAFFQWCRHILGLCLAAFLQSTILTAGLMVFREHALLGLGLMLSADEIPRLAGSFGLDTSMSVRNVFHTAQAVAGTACSAARVATRL